MNNRLPDGITDEKDLELFEKYLNDVEKDCSDSFISCIKNHKGKLIKVESLIAGRLYCRRGILTAVGSDYIVITHSSFGSTIICLNDIKYITVVRDNSSKTVLQ